MDLVWQRGGFFFMLKLFSNRTSKQWNIIQPLSPCKSGVDALMLLWLAMLLACTDFVDDDPPKLLAVCIFENDPIILLTCGGAAATMVAVAQVDAAPVSPKRVFSPNSQYVVTLPLPCTKLDNIDITMGVLELFYFTWG